MNKYYCPKCNQELEVLSSCGAVNYFCNTCNELKSSKSILTEEEHNQILAKNE